MKVWNYRLRYMLRSIELRRLARDWQSQHKHLHTDRTGTVGHLSKPYTLHTQRRMLSFKDTTRGNYSLMWSKSVKWRKGIQLNKQETCFLWGMWLYTRPHHNRQWKVKINFGHLNIFNCICKLFEKDILYINLFGAIKAQAWHICSLPHL